MKRPNALGAALTSLRRKFAPTRLSRALREIFSSSGMGTTPIARTRRGFVMEPLEPRLLLSATIDYTAALATDFSLTADDATHVRLAGGSYDSGTIDLAAGSGVLDLLRTGGAEDVAADTIRLNLASLQMLTTGLTINFTGGLQTLLSHDLVQLENAGSFGFDVSVNADSAIHVDSGASLTAAGHDISLASHESSTGLPGLDDDFYAQATHASVTVSGDLSAENISLTADSTIDADNSSLSLGGLQLAFIYADSTSKVEISGASSVTATGKLDLIATSKVSAVADMKSSGGDTDSSTDAAVASVVITSNGTARIGGSASVNVTGALTVSAKNTSLAAAIADGSAAGAGATLGVAVITGTTEASIQGGAGVQAGSISVLAERLNDATALAKSTPAGATTSGSKQDSQKALEDNKAESSDGSIDLAGAVAVGTVVSNSHAFVDSSALVQSGAGLDIQSKSVSSSQTLADGSSTASDSGADGGKGNVAIAVAIGVGDLNNDAYVAGTGGVSAGSLSVKALMGSQDRELDFVSGDLDTSKGTIALTGGAHGLKDGDEVVYHQTGTRSISQLTDGNHYYVVGQDDGRIKLSPNADGSSPIGTFTLGG
ncbi:MAG TPA: LEPR-XLL domain-containing protein, partial [Burkholderiales bacterium]|nr:LEPR-XLL domain-containing protein [Burkholderiales bacterium]